MRLPQIPHVRRLVALLRCLEAFGSWVPLPRAFGRGSEDRPYNQKCGSTWVSSTDQQAELATYEELTQSIFLHH